MNLYTMTPPDLPAIVRWRQDVPTVGYNPHRVTMIVKVGGVSWRYCRECGGWQATNASNLHG